MSLRLAELGANAQFEREQHGDIWHAGASDSGATCARLIEAEAFRMLPVAFVWCAQPYAQHMTYLPRS